MITKKKSTKQKEYGVYQVDSPRHGRCWAFSITWFDSNGMRQRKMKSGFRTRDEAQTIVDEIRRNNRYEKLGYESPSNVGKKKLKDTTVAEAVDAYTRAKEVERVSRRKSQNPNARWSRGQLDLLSRWVELVGADRPIKSINADILNEWAAHEIGRGLQLSSVSRSLNTIRACLNHAQKNREDLANYRVPAKSLKKKVADIPRERYLEEDEIKALSKALADNAEYRDAYDFFRISLGTASRVDEILGLMWRDVDYKKETVRLYASKTNKEKKLRIPVVVDLISKRKAAGLGSETHVFSCRDHHLILNCRTK